jgi:Abortive infection C-terminus
MSVNILYKASGGSQEIELVEKIPTPHFEVIKRGAIRYLKADYASPGTIEMMNELPFELWQATNSFADDFEVLYLKAGMSTYVEIENEVGIWRDRITDGCPHIAKALERVGHPVRFIAAGLDLDEGVADVASPALAITSDVVEEALRNAETLIGIHGPASGLDRVHTALHGYLLSACAKAGIPVKRNSAVTELFARLREQHPALAISDPQEKQRIDQILRGMARIIDALDPLRNMKTLAHPNPLLSDAEAMLAINLVRTMLRYLDSRFS